MRTEVTKPNTINGALLEKVILGNDLSGLTSIEKVQYVKHICDSLGLNSLTQPIKIMKFQGKEIPYFSKDATEQIRKINNISIEIKETKILDDLYIVVAEATTTDGRKDSSTAAITIGGLKGDAKANALMKCETKAKRRVTLSICGLGFIDESEAETLPNIKKQDISILSEAMNLISSSGTLKELETNYHQAIALLSNDIEGKKEINRETKILKEKLTVKEWNEEIDQSTGEVKDAPL